MKREYLTESEKALLRFLGKGSYSGGNQIGLSEDELSISSDRLRDMGMIEALYAEGHELMRARITSRGRVYLQENPNLENPINDEDLKRLQKDDFEYKKKIRWQESVIRKWQLISAMLGILWIVTSLLLLFFNVWKNL